MRQHIPHNSVENLHVVCIPHRQRSHPHESQWRVKSRDIAGHRMEGALIVSGEEIDQRDHWVTREPLREFLHHRWQTNVAYRNCINLLCRIYKSLPFKRLSRAIQNQLPLLMLLESGLLHQKPGVRVRPKRSLNSAAGQSILNQSHACFVQHPVIRKLAACQALCGTVGIT